MKMKIVVLVGIIAMCFAAGATMVTAQGPQPRSPQATVGTAFTYQGQLKQNGSPVNGSVSLSFKLYSTPTGGSPLGTVNQSLNLANGLFTTQLDFGASTSSAFDGSERWLGISIASDPELTPRQPLTAVPYALYSSGNWGLSGNVGTSPVTNFVGTTDNQALVFKTNNAEAMRLDSTGKLGVGTTTPSDKLTVANGNIHAVSNTTGEGFEAVTFPPAGWTTGGNAPWVMTTTVFYQGAASATSGAIGNSQSSFLNTDFTFPSAGFARFVWKVDSEPNYDLLLFCLDNPSCTSGGGYYKSISGNVDWSEVVLPVSAGTHSFRWVYSKDNVISVGRDRGWLDNVRFQANGSLYVDTYVGIGTTNPINALSVVGGADFHGKVGIGVTNPVQLLHMNVITGDREGIEIDSPIAGHAPAIYLNHTGNLGRNYRIASYGDNTNPGSFRIRDETGGADRLTIESTGRTTVNGVFGVYDAGRTFNAGVATEVSAQLIDFGINDDSANRFGGAYTSAAPGGFLRVDARGGVSLFQFLARPAASSSPVVEVMGITSDGKVGIGVPNPTFQLQLSTDSAAKPNGGSWSNPSDARLKENIQPFTDGLTVLNQINPVSYSLNGKAGLPKGSRGIGVIAQDVKDVIPYTVATFKAKLNPDDVEETELFKFDSSALTFVTINAVKELSAKVDTLSAATEPTAEVSALKAENATLQQQVAALQQQNSAVVTRLTALELKVEAQGTASAPSVQAALSPLMDLAKGGNMVSFAFVALVALLVGRKLRA